MTRWYFDKMKLRSTPSIVKDGIDYETECRYRKKGARFIIEMCTKMNLGCNTMATGVVYFHRFYMVHSFLSFPKYLIGCSALFLAGKVEETPKMAKDIVKMAQITLPPSEFAKFGEDPLEKLFVLERILLQSIEFDLQVHHPYAFLSKYAKSFRGNKQKIEEVLQMAWYFVNDSLRTTLCLQWEAEILAIAMLYTAAKLKKFNIESWAGKTPGQTCWWETFVSNVPPKLLEGIYQQVYDLSPRKNISSSNVSSSSLRYVKHSRVKSCPIVKSASPNNSITDANTEMNRNVPESSDVVGVLSKPVSPVVSDAMSNSSAIRSINSTSYVTQSPPIPPPALPVNIFTRDANTTAVFPPQNQYSSILTRQYNNLYECYTPTPNRKRKIEDWNFDDYV